jgi:hypothetical protein
MSTWSRQKTNNCRQTNAQKTEDRAARTPLKPGMNTGGPGKQFLVHYWHMYYLVWISLILIRKLLCCLSLSTTGAIVAVIIWSLDQQLPAQSVTITTKIVSSNPIHGEVYSRQHYVIKFVRDLRQVSNFLRVLRFPQPIKSTATIQLKYCWKRR